MSMDSPYFALSWLESLSTAELTGLADKYDIDIPPDLDRVFIIEELLYLCRDIETGDSDDLQNNEFNETAFLPKHYDFSFVNIIIRDPLWVFVFWEVDRLGRELYAKDSDFDGYCLRVVPLNDDNQPSKSDPFIITVSMNDDSRYIGFPQNRERSYKIELCARRIGDYTVLAVSNPFTLPRLLAAGVCDDAVRAVYQNPLAAFSGIDNFTFIHGDDRVPRSCSLTADPARDV